MKTPFVMLEELKTSCQKLGFGAADDRCGGAQLDGSLAGKSEGELVHLQRGLARGRSNGTGTVVSSSRVVHWGQSRPRPRVF